MSTAEVFIALKVVQKTMDLASALNGGKALKEQLGLVRAQLEFIGQEKAQAEEELRNMKETIAQLQQELETHRNFRDWRGAKWRILPVGGIDPAVYCGSCGKPAHIGPRTFVCPCGWRSIFPTDLTNLAKLLGEVSQIYGEPFDQAKFLEEFPKAPEKSEGMRAISLPPRNPWPGGW
jgi:hypothetical protein